MKVTIIRTTGEESEIEISRKGAIEAIARAINARCCDTVNLRDGRVMMLDDNGYETRHAVLVPLKPANPKATALYHSVCIPGATHQIVGDVAIVLDKDFA